MDQCGRGGRGGSDRRAGPTLWDRIAGELFDDVRYAQLSWNVFMPHLPGRGIWFSVDEVAKNLVVHVSDARGDSSE